MNKINVNMANGSMQEVLEKGDGTFEMLCPCGTTLPIAPGSLFGTGIPLMCPCGRQYEGLAPESGEMPTEFLEIKPEE